jgi:hypothetical protein
VHTNSGILNHAAYLIATGGNFNGCNITGLGEEKQERLFYQALTRYLQYNSSFYDAYLSIRNACYDLYPSEDCLEVEKALRATELPQAGLCSGIAPVDPGCASVVDQCPTVANQTIAGICGCGMADIDANGNGIMDCNDPKVFGVTPAAPKITAGTKKLAFLLSPFQGAVYYVRLQVTPPGKRKKTTYYQVNSASGLIKRLPSGAVVNLRYYYRIPGTNVFSNPSPIKKTKIK